MNKSVSETDSLDELAEEFIIRYRLGERPTVSEFIARCPQFAEGIRDLFPTLVVMEELKPQDPVPPEANLADCAAEVEMLGQLGDFRIVREIGRGGMGIVYEAVQESLGRQVALKVLPRRAMNSPAWLARFKRESHAAARLHHTNIVPVFGVGEEQGMHFYAMQCIDGEGLDQVLRKLQRRKQACHAQATEADALSVNQSSLSIDPAVQIDPAQPLAYAAEPTLPIQARDLNSSRQAEYKPRLSERKPDETSRSQLSDTVRLLDIANLSGDPANPVGITPISYWLDVARLGARVSDGLAYAHEQGVLHRDIKPSNLLLDNRGEIWISDFGLAKTDEQSDLTHTGELLGTLRYMPPEAFKSHADARSDIYSLGLTLYELLALRPAFEAADRLQLINMVLHKSPPKLRTVNRSIPRDLETIVHKAIERMPGERYQSAKELTDDLERFIRDEPIQAQRPSTVSLILRWCRRNRIVAGLAGLVGLLLVTTTIGSLVAATLFQAINEKTTKSLQQERKSLHDNQLQLFKTSLAQAKSSRMSGRPGQRLEALEAVRTGASLVEPLGLGEDQRYQLRSEAMSAMTLVDMKKLRSWGGLAMSSSVPFSADFEWFACTSEDGKSLSIRRVGKPTVDVLDIPTELTPNSTALGFSPDCQRLWSFDFAQQTSGLFDCATGVKIGQHSVQLKDSSAIDTHPTLPQAVVGDVHGKLRIWELNNDQLSDWVAAEAGISSVRYSPDGNRLAISRTDGTLEIRHAETGVIERAWPGLNRSRAIAWRGDGAYLAVAQGLEIHIIELSEPAEHAEYFVCRGHQAEVVSLRFHPTQPQLVSSSWDGTTRLWDAVRGVEALRLIGALIGFDKEGRWLAIRRGMTVELWELVLPEALRWLDQRWISGIALHPHGNLLAAAYTDGVRLWDLQRKMFIGHLPIGSTTELVFDPPSGDLVTTGVSGVWRWPIDKGELQQNLVQIGPPTLLHADLHPTRFIRISRNGELLLAEGFNYHDASLVDLRAEAPVLNSLNKPGIASTALSPDGRWAVTGNMRLGDGIAILDTHSRAMIDRVPCRGIGPMLFSPDNEWLVGNTGHSILFWKTKVWQLDHEIPIETNGGSAIAFSPDSQLVATGQWGSGLRLFEVSTAAPIAELEILESPPAFVDLEFTADGGSLVAAADVEGLCVWDFRRLRKQLVELGLDWDQPPIPLAHKPAQGLWRLQADLGTLSPAKTQQP